MLLAFLCLAASLLQGVAQALPLVAPPNPADGETIELCTPDGLLVVDPLTGKPADHKTKHRHDHCPGCRVHPVGPSYLPTAILELVIGERQESGLQDDQVDRHRPDASALSRQPRAPPL